MDSQIERLTYERILSSQNQLIVKEAEDAASRQAQLTPADIIKDPYVLDFLGLPSGVNFYEKDLEKALIDNLQQFLLELLCKPLHNISYANKFIMQSDLN